MKEKLLMRWFDGLSVFSLLKNILDINDKYNKMLQTGPYFFFVINLVSVKENYIKKLSFSVTPYYNAH